MSNNKTFQTGNVILISIAHFVHDVYSSFLAPILPLLIEKLSMTYTQAGLLTVLQRLPSLFNPIIGILADSISVKLFIIISPAITVIVMSLLGLAPTYIILGGLLLVMGISASMFHVPAPVMIKQLSGERIGKGMSYFMLGGELARSIGPLVILGGISVWGLESTYKLIPFGLMASFILYHRFKGIKAVHNNKKRSNQKIIAALKEYKNLFLIIFGILFFTSIIKGTITTFLTVYLTNQGDTIWYAGAALSIFQFAGAGGTFLSGTISDKIGRKNVLFISAVLNPILLIGFISTVGVISFIILLILGFFIFAFTPILLAIVNDSKSEFPTFLNGVFMTINFLTSAVTISLIGLFADYFSLETTYLIAAVTGIITVPFVIKLKI